MKRFILTLLIIPSLLVSQEEINRNLGEFTKLSIYDGINVELIKSDEKKSYNFYLNKLKTIPFILTANNVIVQIVGKMPIVQIGHTVTK